jgi:DNA-binding transcriptional ArsR family regulator
VAGLLVTPESRQARRRLGTTAWAVLEDVALDAYRDDHGRLLAVTNVRRIACHLGISKDTAARALVRLADAGLVERQRLRNDTGAFTASVYVVHLVESSGLAHLAGDRCPAIPRPASRDTVTTRPADIEGQGDGKSVAVRRIRSRRGSSSRRASRSEQGDLFDTGLLAEQLR